MIPFVLVVSLLARGGAAQEGFEGWHLEPGIAQAHLVMVARVASIGRLTVVEGAKTDVVLREYRFQPVRRLKGIFQREVLSMTAADLGCAADDASLAPPLKEGEFRLLILAQQQGRFLGCVSAAPGAATFDERVPLLNGPDDPLVGVVETLIQVADSRSRRERAALLVERLADAAGVSAVPLLSSLRLRADWAAADGRAYAPLARLAQDRSPAVREAALGTLRDMLFAHAAPRESDQLDGVAQSLRALLESDVAVTQLRVTALESLEHLLAVQPAFDWHGELLTGQLTAAATGAERAAAVAALARSVDGRVAVTVLDALAQLPLDEPPARESVYARATLRMLFSKGAQQPIADITRVQRVLLDRLKRSMAARQSLEVEIESLGRLQSKESVPLLLSAAGQSQLSARDRNQIAIALGKLGDDRAVPLLVAWLRGADYDLKGLALAALETIDSPLAAREARPLLKSEAHLPFKLRLARLLARHQLADGYALATEHLSDTAHTADATLVLAALADPRTSGDLSAIIVARPDRRWHAAALTGLAAIGDASARAQLLEILGDERHALAADAAEAAGLAGDEQLLLPLANLVRSRNRQIALSSLLALRRALSGVRTAPRGLAAVDQNNDGAQPAAVEIPEEAREAIFAAVAALAVDAYVDADVRQEALNVARLLQGRYDELLAEVADQAELEGSALLMAVQAEMRRLRDRTTNGPIGLTSTEPDRRNSRSTRGRSR